VIITTSDGQRYDLSQDYADLIKDIASPPDYLTCDQSTGNNPIVNYVVNVNGADVAWASRAQSRHSLAQTLSIQNS
jgi:hypothetical protein